MEKIRITPMYNGEHQIYIGELFYGKICRGEVRGEWWCETERFSNKPYALIKGKKAAINYLTKL